MRMKTMIAGTFAAVIISTSASGTIGYNIGKSAAISDYQSIMQEQIDLKDIEIEDLKRSNAWAAENTGKDAYSAGVCNAIDWLELYEDPENEGKVLVEVDFTDGTGLERFCVEVQPYENLR